MTILRAGDRPDFHTLPAGQVLTVVPSPVGTGVVWQYPDTGSNPTSGTPMSGSVTTVGPFTGSVRLGVECRSGAIDWAAGRPASFPAPALGDNEVAGTKGAVSGAWKEFANVIWYGDSYGMRSNANNAISAATVSNGVMTITTSSAHGLGPGMPVSLVGPAIASCRFIQQPAITASASTLTVAVPGAPDGTVAVSASVRGQMYLVKCERFIEEGTFLHLQRRSGYGFDMLRNMGQQGHTVAELASLWPTLVAPFEADADMIVFEAGYNSIATSEDVNTVLGAYSSMIAMATKPLFIFTPWPVASGSSADSASKLQLALSIYWGLKALCAANSKRVTLVDIFEGTVAPATGYVQSGFMQSDGVHKAPRGSDYAAQMLLARIPSEWRPARTLVASSLDTVATDAANPNIARNGLGITTTGGANTGFTASAPADETTGTGAVMANFTVSATSVTGNVFWKPAAVGNAQCLRITADASTDQGRLTFNLTPGDIVAGGKLDILFKFKLRTDFNASNKTPAAQNVRYVTMQLVLSDGSTTYTTEFSNFGVTPTASVYILSDIDSAIAATGLVVPAGFTYTTARIDCICSFDGAGSGQMEMSQVTVRKVS